MKAFSYSFISDFYTCPELYRLKHVEGVDLQDPSVDTEAGTALHMGINAILKGKDEDYAIELAQMYFETIKDKDLKRFSYSWDELNAHLPVWIRKFVKGHAKHFKPLIMEERLKGTIGGHAFEGTPDFVGWYKDIPSIVDFKTSTKRWDVLKAQSDDQMPGYAELVNQAHKFKAEQVVYLVFVKDRRDPSIQNPIINVLTEVVTCSKIDNMKMQMDDIANRDSFPKNTRSCVRGPIVCAAFHLCHGGKKS